jgi:hypothetical protein
MRNNNFNCFIQTIVLEDINGNQPHWRMDMPLKLLWGYDVERYRPDIFKPHSTIIAKRQGIVVQRNYFCEDIKQIGLMCYAGGAGYVHSHTTGIDMELYGLGEVLGVQGGKSARGSDYHRKYLFVYAGYNTVVVNGTSHGKGGWQDMAQNTTQTIALEPIVTIHYRQEQEVLNLNE